MPQSMARSQAGRVECRSVGIGCGTDHQMGSLLNGRKSAVLRFELQVGLAMGQALFVTSFPLSLVVLLNSPLLLTEPGAGWKFPASGSTGHPTHDFRRLSAEASTRSNSAVTLLCHESSPGRNNKCEQLRTSSNTSN